MLGDDSRGAEAACGPPCEGWPRARTKTHYQNQGRPSDHSPTTPSSYWHERQSGIQEAFSDPLLKRLRVNTVGVKLVVLRQLGNFCALHRSRFEATDPFKTRLFRAGDFVTDRSDSWAS
jgi:hypothetical protein